MNNIIENTIIDLPNFEDRIKYINYSYKISDSYSHTKELHFIVSLLVYEFYKKGYSPEDIADLIIKYPELNNDFSVIHGFLFNLLTEDLESYFKSYNFIMSIIENLIEKGFSIPMQLMDLSFHNICSHVYFSSNNLLDIVELIVGLNYKYWITGKFNYDSMINYSEYFKKEDEIETIMENNAYIVKLSNIINNYDILVISEEASYLVTEDLKVIKEFLETNIDKTKRIFNGLMNDKIENSFKTIISKINNELKFRNENFMI